MLNNKKKIITLVFTILFVFSFLTACTNENNRKIIPPQQSAQNNMIKGTEAPRISAIFEMSDITYGKITVSILNIRSNAGLQYPIIGKLYTSEKFRTIGRMDGWYVIRIPGTYSLGCVSTRYVVPYTDIVATPIPAPKPMPMPSPVTNTPPITLPGGNYGTNPGTIPGSNPNGNGTTTTTGAGALSADAATIISMCNQERAKVGAGPLTSNSQLAQISTLKSQDMVSNNYFAHQSPTYGSPFDMMRKYGVTYMYAGENIAINSTAARAVQAWMGSEGHRKNILNPNFTEIGIGIAPKGNGSYVYTQEFIGN